MTELPVAGYSPESPTTPTPDITDIVSDIAEAIKPDNPLGEVNVRVGVVTAVESSSPYRVQLDISGIAWLSRTADASMKVGDKVWAVQQGEVIIAAGRLNAIDSFTPIGSLLPYAGSTAPSGWLIADGSAVSRTTYAALYAVCGTTYGAGNGTTTFNLPNLQNRVPVGSGGTYSRGGTGGAATVTLTTTSMPSHSHGTSSMSAGSAGSHSHSGSSGSASHSHSVGNQSTRSDILAGGGTTTASTGGGSTGSDSHSHSITVDSGGSHTHSVSGSVDSAGSGGSHENMPPYVAMPYIIRAT